MIINETIQSQRGYDMATNKLFMAVDLGTSFIKTGVYALDGVCLAMASEPVQDERPGPGIFLQVTFDIG